MSGRVKVIHETLIALGDKNGGRLTPELVVDAAKDKKSPLHSQFEWDDKKAGHQYRIEQARTLIRSVQVVITVDSRRVSSVYYVRDPAAESNVQGYISIPQLRTDSELARDAIVSEFARAASALDRAHRIAAALNLEGEVQELSERVRSLSERASGLARPENVRQESARQS